MKLYLVQHGEACSKDVDPERPLTEQGQKDIDHLARFLKRSEQQVDRVIHSGKLRARQTAEQLAKVLSPTIELEHSSLINPNDDPAIFVAWLEQQKRNTLVVGHLPFMARLISYLLTGDVNRILVAYQPGSMVCLETSEGVDWQVNWMVRPELLA